MSESPATPAGSNDAQAERAFPARHVIFAVLWAAGMLFHLAVFDQLIEYAAVTFTALLVLFRPRSLPCFLLLAAAQVQAGWDMSPGYPNHWLLAMCMNAGVLLAAMRLAVVKRTLSLDFRAVFDDFVPPMRVMLLLLYFWATFAKLNTGYFTPQTSCAVWELEMILAPFPALASSSVVQWLGIVGSVATEGAIFVLLLVPRYRVAGIVLGGAFHLMLSIKAYHGFISILFAQYFLFTPESFPEEGLRRARGALDRLPQPSPALVRRLPAIGRAVACAAVAILITCDHTPWWNGTKSVYDAIQRTLFFVWGPSLFLFFLLVQVAPPRAARPTPGALRIRHASLALLPLLVLLNGAAPYLGLKTEASFAMFSNLRTEGGRSNHFVVRRSLRLAGWDDLVEIVASPWPRVDAMQELGHRFTFFQLRKYASHPTRRNAEITYVRDGEARHVDRVGDSPEIGRRYPYLVRKLVFFRAPKAPYGSCQH